MGSRKETPDILGELLGGSIHISPEPTTGPIAPEQQVKSTVESKSGKSPLDSQASPRNEVKVNDIEYGENLLASAASTLKAAGRVLDRRRLLDWLEQMHYTLGQEDASGGRRPPKSALENRVAEWAERHLKAMSTTISCLANGLSAKRRYKVDVWAHLKGDPFRSDLDLWIDCRKENNPVTTKDVREFVEKATDVFHAAHTDIQEFWFDRLMFVSLNPFEKDVLDLADEYGVICVFYDRTSFLIQSDPYWRLKPRWLRDAESSQQ